MPSFYKKSGGGGRSKRSGFDGLLILFLCFFLLGSGLPAQAQSTFDRSNLPESTSEQSTFELGTQLMEHYQRVGTAFWEAEELRNAQTISPDQRKVLLATPLPTSHLAHPKYFQAAAAADSFLKIVDENKMQNWMRDPVLYFGGLAHFSLGNYPRAETLFSRLSPNYLRDYYINDRDPVNPEFSTPTKSGISKLLFYCQLKTLPETPEDALAALQQITAQAQSTLAAQSEYAQWLANRKSVHARRQFSESNFGGQPDQLRASALPSTLELLETAWDGLLPEAIKKSNLLVRDYLRTLIAPESTLRESTSGSTLDQGLQSIFVIISAPRPSLSLLASLKLQEIDAHIIRSYFSQAQRQLNANNFDGARRYYKRIINEYPKSESAQRAETQFPKVTRLAVAHYKAEGQKHFQPVNNIGVPQTKSREYFEKLLKEDPNSDYALYYHSRALGTENKLLQAIRQLQSFERKHPESPLLASAMYLHGFLLASQKPPDYKRAVAIMDKIAQEFPRSDEAPEALFHAGVYLAWQSQFPESIARLEQIEKYPKSIRHKWAKPFIAYLQSKIKDGTQWP